MNTAKKAVSMAHKTCLAGAGAVGTGQEKAVDKIDQLFVDGSQFLNDLLHKGESVEAQIQAKLEARNMLKDKISALKAKLGFGNESRDQEIDMLTQRVDSLIEVVAKLAQQKAAERKVAAAAPAKAPATKTATTTSKVATKPAAKTTATKAPAKTVAKPATKTTAKKAPAKAAAKPAAKSTVSKTAAKTTASKAPAKTASKAASETKTDNKD